MRIDRTKRTDGAAAGGWEARHGRNVLPRIGGGNGRARKSLTIPRFVRSVRLQYLRAAPSPSIPIFIRPATRIPRDPQGRRRSVPRFRHARGGIRIDPRRGERMKAPLTSAGRRA